MKKKSEENSGLSRRTSTEGSTGRKKSSGDFEPPTKSDRAPRRESTGSNDRPDRPARPSYGDRPDRPARPSYGDRPDRPARPSFGDRPDRPARPTRSAGGDRPDRPAPKSQRIDRLKKNLEDMDRDPALDLAAEWNDLQLQNLSQEFGPEPDSESIPKARPRTKPKVAKSSDALAWPMRANRYVSLSGLCSRRTADELISAGRITINEQVADVLGTKVNADDVVRYDGEVLTLRRYVYVLLNKPKDYITTMDDPENRRPRGDPCPCHRALRGRPRGLEGHGRLHRRLGRPFGLHSGGCEPPSSPVAPRR